MISPSASTLKIYRIELAGDSVDRIVAAYDPKQAIDTVMATVVDKRVETLREIESPEGSGAIVLCACCASPRKDDESVACLAPRVEETVQATSCPFKVGDRARIVGAEPKGQTCVILRVDNDDTVKVSLDSDHTEVFVFWKSLEAV